MKKALLDEQKQIIELETSRLRTILEARISELE